ncbi:MAG: hypothetical protein J0M36_05175 [Caulobacterales bacterium]|nr:hypothetical protein [Caulobacterales bacterium]
MREQFPEFFAFLDEGKVNVLYIDYLRIFGIRLSNEMSYQQINFCPWTGKEFPKDLSSEFYEELDSMGIDYIDDPDGVPDIFKSDRWWQSKLS